jgi:menaquinol-cytochrome c reductase iron-sulfur subunit
MEPSNPSEPGGPPPAAASDPRRRFVMKALAVGSGGLAYAVPALAGIAAFLNPLKQKGQAGQLLRVASLDTLPQDGTPRKVSIVSDRTDAWNRFPNEPVGAVMLRRAGDGQVEALNVVCPHAGCSVQYEPGPGKFFCPCHGATFDLSGKRLDKTSPSPRDLDTLEVEIRNGTEVWVHFQDFRPGIAEKVPEA